MSTPIGEVIKSSAVAGSLAAAGYPLADDAASLTDSQLLAIKNVGPTSIGHLRAWQRTYGIPVPPEPGGYSQEMDLAEAVQFRVEQVCQMAAKIYTEAVISDLERHQDLGDVELQGLRQAAFRAAEVFYGFVEEPPA